MKGKTNNPNGRPKGVPNKVTSDLRQWIADFINKNKGQILDDWKALEAKDRFILFEKLLKYILPTLQATTLTTDYERLTDEDLNNIISRLTNGQTEKNTIA